VTTESSALRTEKDYINFAKQVSKVLYDGHAGYNIPAFMNEVLRGVGKNPSTTGEDMKKVVDTVTVVYNSKVAEEKKKDTGKAKKAKANAKPMIAQSKSLATYERNNNPGMVNDLTGDDNGYGAEYGEEGEVKGREPEN